MFRDSGFRLDSTVDLWVRCFVYQSSTDADSLVALFFPPSRFSIFLVETVGHIVRSKKDFVDAVDCGDYFVVSEFSGCCFCCHQLQRTARPFSNPSPRDTRVRRARVRESRFKEERIKVQGRKNQGRGNQGRGNQGSRFKEKRRGIQGSYVDDSVVLPLGMTTES